MEHTNSPRRLSRDDAIRIGVALCLLAIVVSVLALIGWAFDVARLKSVVPNLTTMKVNTAIGLLASGVGLLDLSRRSRRIVGMAPIAAAAGGVATLIGGVTLFEYATGVRLGLDELIFADPATTSAPYNGRMSPAAALSLSTMGPAILMLGGSGGRGRVLAAHWLSVPSAATGMLSLVGYAYGVEQLHSLKPYASVALNTSIALCALSGALLLTRADEGWLRAFVGRPSARAVLSRLVPLSVSTPFVIGLVVLQGVYAGLYEPLFGLSLFAVAAIAAFVGLSWTIADAAGRTEAALALSEMRFRQIAEALPNMVFIADSGGFNTYTNSTFQEFTGATSAALTGTGWLDAIHPDDVDAARERWRRAISAGEAYEVECRFRRRDGRYVWHLGRARPLLDAEGRISSWFGTCTDIQDMIDARDALSRSNDELEVRVADRTAELLQSQKMEAVGQLTGGVAHDFNNLLTVIRSSTDLLKRPNLAEERRARYVAAISDTADRAAKLTGQLLAFARRQALKPEVFAACDGVRALSDMMGTLAGSRIAVTTDLPVVPCFIDADPSQFDTALVNLAVNARDAMDGQGRIAIAVRAVDAIPAGRARTLQVGAFVAVSVSDTGSGIPSERIERIFEPFFTTKGVGKGTGLGLSQVFGFSKQSGGDIIVDSTVGEGTTFTLYLPRVTAPAPAAAAEAPKVLADGHGTRVLVVEDNADVGAFAVQSLADSGYSTVLAMDGAQALVELAKDPTRFDVVFSDVMMPGMDGVELAQEVRRLYEDLPVVLTSGYSHVLAQNGTHGFELLHKPYSIEQLSQVLQKAAVRPSRGRLREGSSEARSAMDARRGAT